MSIDFEAWLAQPGNFRCHLVEVDYLDAGTLKTLYLSNAPFQTVGTDSPAHTPYNDVIVDEIKLGQRMDSVFYGHSTTIRSAIKILATEFIPDLLSFDFAGQQARIYMGDPDWPKADFKQTNLWYCEDIEPDGFNYLLRILDATHPIEVPVCNKYTSGIAEGKSIPRVFGTVFNVEPVLINELGDGTYQINDGPLDSITVRDGGLLVSVSEDLTAGTFVPNSTPQGRITCDAVQADSTCAEIVTIMLNESGLTARDGTFSSVPGYAMGAYISNNKTRRNLIDEACISAGFAWGVDSNNAFKTIAYTALSGVGVALLTDDDIDPDTFKTKRRLLPAPRVNVHYQRNYTVQPDGLFGSVSAVNRDLFSKQWSVSIATNTDIVTNHPDYPEINAYTLLVNKADADNEAANRAALNTKIRLVYSMSAFGRAIGFELGDELDSSFVSVMGGTCVVVANQPIPALGLAVLEVMQ
ncbi:MAG: hypothetical protein HRT38_02710 [Alteromonadaceae bacterium]|nr:hypothetical protein [Alteromonadaceae bacterium]